MICSLIFSFIFTLLVTAKMEPKLKFLALHGHQQSQQIFRVKLGSIRNKLKKLVDFSIIDAPHVVKIDDYRGDLSAEHEEENCRTWFHRKDDVIDIDSLETSIQHIKDFWKAEGPFDGILGFSMGGTLAAYIALESASASALDGNGKDNDNVFRSLKMAVCIGAPDVNKLLDVRKVVAKQQQQQQFTTLPTFHMAGKNDKIVDTERSRLLYDRFSKTSSEFVVHDLGHGIPSKAIYLKKLVEFVNKNK